MHKKYVHVILIRVKKFFCQIVNKYFSVIYNGTKFIITQYISTIYQFAVYKLYCICT